MSSGSYKQVDVGCPFYKYDDGRARIVCEGIDSEDDSVALIYREKLRYEKQMKVFCCSEYTKCEVYRMLMEKYKDD
jgi:hypothetical protein